MKMAHRVIPTNAYPFLIPIPAYPQDHSTIGAMQSMETEVVEFSGGAVRVTEQIESWLGDLSSAMKGTLMAQLEAVRSGRMQVWEYNV